MEFALRLERKSFSDIGKDLRREAVQYVAEANLFDTAQQWVNSLQWDGVPRVESFLRTYLRAEDTAYTRAVSLYMWTAVAGRVLMPGCQADMVPILVGPQGTFKTSSVSAICPSDEFFISIDLGLKDDELSRLMRGKLVIELGELKGWTARDAEHIKALISRKTEEWVPKYQELPTRYHRRSLFFGTSNRNDFLVDPTGERRMLPFNCGPCDPEAIARDRDQLWAEARELFKTHGVIHREAEKLAQDEHAAFADVDEWQHAISGWLRTPDMLDGRPPESRSYLTGREVLTGALGIQDAHQTRAHQSRVKGVLMKLGYEQRSMRIDGHKQRVYVAPSLF